MPTLVELHRADRLHAAPLFGELATTDGCVAAGLSGEFGRLWVDDAAAPATVHLHLDFHFLYGDPGTPAAAAIVHALPDRLAINTGPSWEAPLRAAYGEALERYTRTAYGRAPHDRARLAAFIDALPDGYRLVRVTAENVERFAALDSSLTGSFRDLAHYVARGIGFAVEHDGAIVAGCSSFARGGDIVEIEIDTAREHRRRGLALATGAAFVLHCLEHGLEPHWDAANEGSSRLADKLGFGEARPYPAWYARERAGSGS